MEDLLARDERIERVDVGMLRNVAETYLSTAARLQVVLYPEEYRSEEEDSQDG
jgi:hypothetical protein